MLMITPSLPPDSAMWNARLRNVPADSLTDFSSKSNLFSAARQILSAGRRVKSQWRDWAERVRSWTRRMNLIVPLFRKVCYTVSRLLDRGAVHSQRKEELWKTAHWTLSALA